MKTQTLKIEIPIGYEFDTFDKSSGEIKLKAKAKTNAVERILTVADVLLDHGLTQGRFDEACVGLTPDEKAYRLLKLMSASLNEGWTPDWSDSSEYKYVPYFEMRGSSGCRFDDCVRWPSHSLVGSRLCFKSRALAEHAGKHFTSVYQQFMVIE